MTYVVPDDGVDQVVVGTEDDVGALSQLTGGKKRAALKIQRLK